ncbi:mitogen-activated protein kinase kinase kinase 19 [Bombina bombina]|uniref:mitogen-activated protein kinase kinase kinase 19 n=1 Tax=Bombina bombina TaxID=8345 RepID=UPI00235AFF03|nr:mitogen-activated protein kinase kinase kinase 19 [Bombina bombina]
MKITEEFLCTFLEAVADGDLSVLTSCFEFVYTDHKHVNFQHTDSGNTALILAAAGNLPEAVSLLLEHGADVTLCNYSNQTAVHVANDDIKKLLLSAVKRTSYPQLQLAQAAWQGDLEIVQQLLETDQSLDIDVQNKQGLTPLMLAVRDIDLFDKLPVGDYRPLDVLQELLKHNANPRLCDFCGKSAMCYTSGVRSPMGQQLADILAMCLATTDSKGDKFSDCCLDIKHHSLNLHPSVGDRESLIITSCSQSPEIYVNEEEIHNLEPRTENFRADCRNLTEFERANITVLEIAEAYQECENHQPLLHRLWPSELSSNVETMNFHTKRHTSLPPFHLKEDAQIRRLGLGYLVQGSCSEPNISQSHLGTDAFRDIKEIKQNIKQRLMSSESTRKKQDVPYLCHSPRSIRLLPIESKKTKNKNEVNLTIGQFMLPHSDSFPQSVPPQRHLAVPKENPPELYKRGDIVLSQDMVVLRVEDDLMSSEDLKEKIDERTLKHKGNCCNNSNSDEFIQIFENKKSIGSMHENKASELCKNKTTSKYGTENHASDYYEDLRIEMSRNNEFVTEGIITKPVDAISGKILPENKENTRNNIDFKEKPKTHSGDGNRCQNDIAEDILDTSETQTINGEYSRETTSWVNGIIECNSIRTPRQMALPLVHITFSEQEPQKELNVFPVKPFNLKKKTIVCGVPHNVNHSFNVIAQNKSGKTKNCKQIRNKSAPESSVKHRQRPLFNSKKLKDVLCPSLAFSGPQMASRQSKKAHHTEPKTLHKSGQRSHTCLSISPEKRSYSQSKAMHHSSSRASTAPGFSDLSYKDMFKEIKPHMQGPGIFQMFETPFYYNAEVDQVRKGHLVSTNTKSSSKSIQLTCQSGNSKAKTEKRHNSRKTKSSAGSNQKHLSAKEKLRSGLEKNAKQVDVVIISGTDWEITAAREHRINKEDSYISEGQVIEPYQYNIDYPDLSIIKEATVESHSNINKANNMNNIITLIEEVGNTDTIETVLPEYLDPTNRVSLSVVEGCQHSTNQPTGSSDEHLGILETGQVLQKPTNKGSLQENLAAIDVQSVEEKINETDLKAQENSKSHFFIENGLRDSLNSSNKSNSKSICSNSKTYRNNSADSEQLTDMLISLVEKFLCNEETDSINSKTEISSTEDHDQSDGTSNDKEIITPRQTDTSHTSPSKTNSLSLTESVFKFNLNNDGSIAWTKGEVLGKGAYGTVYCGLTSQGELIAAKQVVFEASEPAIAEKEYKKLQEEVNLLKALKHVNIVGYLGTCLQDNIVTIFMEFVPGGSISSVLKRFGPLPEIVFVKYTKQILQGISYLHNNRVIHRDIKGNNIMLMPDGVIKLIDFGCAKQLTNLNMSGTQSELLKSMHGTPYWMAPEVINESGHGKKSDIWSTGCTVFEMATGKPPLAHMNNMAAMYYIGAQRGLMPTLPDHFSKKARDFVDLCLTRDQYERPSAEQLLQHPFIKRKL